MPLELNTATDTEILREIFNRINRRGWMDNKTDREELMGAYLQEHRTLQQGFVRGFVDFLLEMDTSKSASDPRNEASVRFAELLQEMRKDGRLSYFPFI
jgi:hypothetical protein